MLSSFLRWIEGVEEVRILELVDLGASVFNLSYCVDAHLPEDACQRIETRNRPGEGMCAVSSEYL